MVWLFVMHWVCVLLRAKGWRLSCLALLQIAWSWRKWSSGSMAYGWENLQWGHFSGDRALERRFEELKSQRRKHLA